MIKTNTMTDWACLNILQRDKYRSTDTTTLQILHWNGLWANAVKTKHIIHPDLDPYGIILSLWQMEIHCPKWVASPSGSTQWKSVWDTLVFQHYWKRANDSTKMIQQDFRLYKKYHKKLSIPMKIALKSNLKII